MSHVTQPDDPVNLSKSFDDCGDIVISLGLTKREYFAAMAMQGLLANVDDGQMAFGSISHEAVCYADALIVQLNK